MFICAGNIESFSFADSIGIGLVDSAINLTRLCLTKEIEHLLFIGSAGSYGKVGIFDIIESKTAINVESSFLSGTSYTPIDNAISSGDSKIVVNSSNYITCNKEISKRYLEIDANIENMEFYSVLKVASSFNIPCGGLFIVTNYCYEDAKDEFLRNHNKAKDILIEYIKSRAHK